MLTFFSVLRYSLNYSLCQKIKCARRVIFFITIIIGSLVRDNEIHKGKCPKCNHGFGQRETQIRGKAGVWIGPFESVPLARSNIIKFLEGKLPVRTQ